MINYDNGGDDDDGDGDDDDGCGAGVGDDDDDDDGNGNGDGDGDDDGDDDGEIWRYINTFWREVAVALVKATPVANYFDINIVPTSVANWLISYNRCNQ